MKIYTYKKLTEFYEKYLLYKNSDPFFGYYIQRYLALSKALGVDFDKEIKEEYEKEDLRRWFVDSVVATNKSVNPFDGLMEAPKYLCKLFKEHNKDFVQAEAALHKAHYKYQCHLFELIYGIIETNISSAELLKYGFDDSQEEPELCDFW